MILMILTMIITMIAKYNILEVSSSTGEIRTNKRITDVTAAAEGEEEATKNRIDAGIRYKSFVRC